MVDKHVQEQMMSILNRLNVPARVLDRSEVNIVNLEDGIPCVSGGNMYVAVPKTRTVIVCDESYPSAKALLMLACELAGALGVVVSADTESSIDVYLLAMRGDLSGSELEALIHEHQIPDDLKRCVMIFHIVQTDNTSAYELLKEITPLQDKDVLIDMDRHSVALIKDMTDEDSVEELTQFAQALQETLMGETAHQMTVGIGRSFHSMEELRESYLEARRAIEVGRLFSPEESTFVYSRLILERFLMELPKDISAYYHSLLFNRKNQRLFNEEMLYTIDMFFKKDLNLSDTARQLYIHRNTLVYRLDKVQKQIGLDLRSFEDAVTFKILMELKKVSGERVPRKS